MKAYRKDGKQKKEKQKSLRKQFGHCLDEQSRRRGEDGKRKRKGQQITSMETNAVHIDPHLNKRDDTNTKKEFYFIETMRIQGEDLA